MHRTVEIHPSGDHRFTRFLKSAFNKLAFSIDFHPSDFKYWCVWGANQDPVYGQRYNLHHGESSFVLRGISRRWDGLSSIGSVVASNIDIAGPEKVRVWRVSGPWGVARSTNKRVLIEVFRTVGIDQLLYEDVIFHGQEDEEVAVS